MNYEKVNINIYELLKSKYQYFNELIKICSFKININVCELLKSKYQYL